MATVTTKVLQLTCTTTAGTKKTIAVPNPREDLFAAEVVEAMQTVIAKGVLTTSGGGLAELVSAKVVQTTKSDVE